MAGHVLNTRRANLKRSSVNDILFFNCAFKAKNEASFRGWPKGFTFLLCSVFQELLLALK